MRRNIAPGSTACPKCHQIGLAVQDRFKTWATENSTVIKGRVVHVLVCKSDCGWECEGQVMPGYVVFAFDDQEVDDVYGEE